MATSMDTVSNVIGGEWLIKEGTASDIFIPEDFNEEQRMILDMCRQFVSTEVMPLIERIDNHEPGLMESVFEKAGELGLLSASIPEEYGGLGKDFVTSTIINEGLGAGHSFSVAIAAHTGIGSLPILYFGTEEQKQKYLPKLSSGEYKGAYGLTEPGSGSDALGAKTSAVLAEDGKYYVMNGQKCWITNGGFADVFIVFAKVDGDKFTGFIVEKNYEGFTQGPEEHKMGIKGSSTVQLYFQDCKIPVENVLGEIGKGHIIAFNILNIGRLKLCAATQGGSKVTLTETIKYAIAREQFNISIAKFGAIRHKLAEMAIRIWICESGLYRTTNWIDERKTQLLDKGETYAKALLGAAEEFAIECAILKVVGSEVLDYVVDESVQVHGGNGYSEEYHISRAYRDSRINRIFEGTNEINRLLIVDMLLKRAMKEKLDLMSPAQSVAKELMSIPDFNTEEEGAFFKEKKYIINFKKAVLLVAGAAVQKLMMTLDKEQEILMNIADMIMLIFQSESALFRLIKLSEKNGEETMVVETDIVKTFLYDAADKINIAGKNALNSFAEGDELRMMHIGLKRFTKVDPFNTKESRRRIAARLISENRYCF